MTLVRFKNRNRPFTNLITSDFFDMEDFFDNRFWKKGLVNEDFWNGRSGEPALNIREEDRHFEIELAAPGFEKKDFDVSIENGYLTIKAEKEDTEETKKENYTRKEFSYNSFERSLQLPENVLEDKIKAKYNDGILSFKVLKKEEAKKLKPKKVEIA
ncbi:Hsp20/alpha crystallin family protein [Muriicola sp. SD30]|uniref:Hsp20/alpha crystallin family protein n=1 Tax=Muriicola sp. SD30 TaxID=3240936 RepID=UPI00183C706B|nr:Hsp20/alpha crystallin family protein [Muriicola sp.]NNC62121.1 Hsp20/alpha crystallin family protein [Eudoraea sp.]NNK20974.1 Hsp20/alpha crystallin family protein [Flavobacteriaceae bacterium]MBT8290857.1 Hsp20/alpha crystallin family protein [Muriicola sp.]NNK36056.1 Hsp20/alpha crystallin family protein [Eudoraea sp.]